MSRNTSNFYRFSRVAIPTKTERRGKYARRDRFFASRENWTSHSRLNDISRIFHPLVEIKTENPSILKANSGMYHIKGFKNEFFPPQGTRYVPAEIFLFILLLTKKIHQEKKFSRKISNGGSLSNIATNIVCNVSRRNKIYFY